MAPGPKMLRCSLQASDVLLDALPAQLAEPKRACIAPRATRLLPRTRRPRRTVGAEGRRDGRRDGPAGYEASVSTDETCAPAPAPSSGARWWWSPEPDESAASRSCARRPSRAEADLPRGARASAQEWAETAGLEVQLKKIHDGRVSSPLYAEPIGQYMICERRSRASPSRWDRDACAGLLGDPGRGRIVRGESRDTARGPLRGASGAHGDGRALQHGRRDCTGRVAARSWERVFLTVNFFHFFVTREICLRLDGAPEHLASASREPAPLGRRRSLRSFGPAAGDALQGRRHARRWFLDGDGGLRRASPYGRGAYAFKGFAFKPRLRRRPRATPPQ